MQRDQSFEADDRFLFTIDPFFDGRTGYFFEINPSGAMGDGLITGPTGGGDFGGEMNKSWDGIWIARVRRTAIGWTAEIEIPFKTVNFDPNTDTWGANFQRTVKRKNEESLWTGWLRDEGLTRMSNAGRIGGIDGISQGIGLDLKPYVLGSASAAPGRNLPATTGDYDIGLDAFYNLTPALKANFSVNTDFAETEVDERRTNLTRFPLFFEEKREFFLDGANFFEFPGGDESPFFSRRIGLNAGEPQPIVYGAKLIGQASRYDIGFLQVRTSEENLTVDAAPLQLKGEDFTVARVKRRFGSQSSAGMIYTRRATHESIVEPRHTAGADVTIATPDFIGGSTLDSGAWYVHTSKPEFLNDDGERPAEGGATRTAGTRRVARDPYRAEVSFKEVQPAYDAAVGFTPRRNYRSWNPELNWQPRFSNHRWLRGISVEFEGDINLSLDNQVIDRNLQLMPMQLEFNSGDSIEFQLFKQTENLDEDFEISDGVILPVGTGYDWLRYQVVYDGAEHRVFSGARRILLWRFLERRSTRVEPRPDGPPARRHFRSPGRRVQRREPAGGRVRHQAVSPRRAHAVQPVHVALEQRAVRLRERRGGLATALPVDSEAGQRRLLHLDAELAGRDREPLQRARSARRREDRADDSILIRRCPAIALDIASSEGLADDLGERVQDRQQIPAFHHRRRGRRIANQQPQRQRADGREGNGAHAHEAEQSWPEAALGELSGAVGGGFQCCHGLARRLAYSEDRTSLRRFR